MNSNHLAAGAHGHSTAHQRRLCVVAGALLSGNAATRHANPVGSVEKKGEATNPPPKGKAQIALVGAGTWATGWHLPHLHANPHCDISAIVEMGEQHRAALGAQYGCPTFSKLEDLIASDVAVDGVLISSPHRTHFDLGMMAIDAGYNVLIEKPMTVSAEEARTLAAAAQAGGKIFMVNNTANFREQAKAAVELVASGQIGEVQHVQCHMGCPMGDMFNSTDLATWTAPVGVAGINGFGWGQLSHIMSWVFQVTKLQPASAFAFMRRSDVTGADLSDAAAVRCTNGATISISGHSQVTVGKVNTDKADTGLPGGKQIDVRIFGSEGMILYCGDDADPDSGSLQLVRADGENVEVPGFLFEETEKGGTVRSRNP